MNNNYLLNQIESAVVDLTTDIQTLNSVRNAHKLKSFLSIGAGAIMSVAGAGLLFKSGYDIGNLLMTLPIGSLAIGGGGFLINNGINEDVKSKHSAAQQSGLMLKINLLRDKMKPENTNILHKPTKPT